MDNQVITEQLIHHQLSYEQSPDKGKSATQLMEENINFVYSTVNKEFGKYLTIKKELYSAGFYGMAYAANKFVGEQHNNKFISYAIYWIRFYVNEEIRNIYPVSLNQNFLYKRNKINKFIKQYKLDNKDQDPSLVQICKSTGFTKKVVENMYKVNGGDNFNFVSFQQLNNNSNNGDDSTIENILMNEVEASVESKFIVDTGMKFEIDEAVEQLRSLVTKEEFDMFYDCYMAGYTYTEIAQKYNKKYASAAKYYVEKVLTKLREIYVQ